MLRPHSSIGTSRVGGRVATCPSRSRALICPQSSLPHSPRTRLARNAGTTPAELARLNGVDEKELAKLKVGQIIKLPVVD